MNRFKQFFASPVFEEDAEKTRTANLLNAVIWSFVVALSAYGVAAFALPNPQMALPLVGSLILSNLIMLRLMRSGRVRAASHWFLLTVWLLLTAVCLFFGGTETPAFYGYAVVVVAAGLLVGQRGGFAFAGLSIATGLALILLENNDLLPAPLGPNPPVAVWAAMSLYGVIAAAMVRVATRNLEVSLAQAQSNERDLAVSNRELLALRASLEERVTDRTRALAHRTVQLETVAQVSEAMGLILEPEELERRVVQLIQQRFDYYYVGLFLVDEDGQWTGEPHRWAVLRAGTGEAGQRMLEAEHRLEIGGDSMIGACVAEGQARIALDVGEEAVRFDNPLLPETRSEMALPLVARGQVIGALTVQSEREAAFSDEDVSILQTMAAQVANATQNARLFEQTQSALTEAETLYEASRRIVAAQNLEEVVTAVAKGVPIPAINRAVLWTIDRDAAGEVEAFLVAAGWHSGEGTPPMPLGTRFSLAEVPATRLALAPEPIFFTDAQNDDRLDGAAHALLQQQNIRGLAVLPLWVGGEQVGAMLLESEKVYHFAEHEIRPYRSLTGQVAVVVENLRLLQESLRNTEELSALNRVAQVVGESLEQRGMLRNSLKAVLEAVNFGVGLVSVHDADTNALQLAWHEGLPEAMVQQFQQQGLEGTLCELVFQMGQALCIADVRQGAPVDVGSLVKHGLIAYAGVPLFHKGRALGTICIFDHQARYLDEADLMLLEAIGRQIGVGLENASLFDQTQRALADAEAVHRHYLRQEWTTFLQSGLGKQLSGFQDGPDGTEPFLEAAADDESATEARRLSVPIRLRGQTIGAIDLTADEERGWSEGDQSLAASFAEQLALAIENARLFELSQHRAQRERAIREITDKIRGQTDLDAILQTTVRELGRLLGTSRAAVRLGTDTELISPRSEQGVGLHLTVVEA